MLLWFVTGRDALHLNLRRRVRGQRGIVAAVEPDEFDRIYGSWWRRNVMSGAREAVIRSADRYIRAIEG